jgi:hypothetical protein
MTGMLHTKNLWHTLAVPDFVAAFPEHGNEVGCCWMGTNVTGYRCERSAQSFVHDVYSSSQLNLLVRSLATWHPASSALNTKYRRE